MNTEIIITPAQIYTVILSVCGAITAIAAAVAVIVSVVKKFRKPDEERDRKIKEHGVMLEKHEELLQKDHKEIENIKDDNKMIQKGLLVMSRNSLDANDDSKEQLRKYTHDLESYLVDSK